jgi:hypothetical protein
MLISSIEPTLNTDPWRYQQHLEIWVLIIGLLIAFVYAIRVLGPKVVPNGEVISRKQIGTFSLMIFLLLISTDWPLHDIAYVAAHNSYLHHSATCATRNT